MDHRHKPRNPISPNIKFNRSGLLAHSLIVLDPSFPMESRALAPCDDLEATSILYLSGDLSTQLGILQKDVGMSKGPTRIPSEHHGRNAI